MELLQMLTAQLGITNEQARGGSGLLFKMAKETISSDDYKKVVKEIPAIEDLLSAAPKSGGIAGAFGGLAASLGGGAGRFGAFAALATGFKNLNLEPDMIGKFLPIMASFLEAQGGETVKKLLASVPQK